MRALKKNPPDTPFEANRFYEIDDLVTRYKRGKATIYNDVKRGLFPAPFRLGGSARWSEAQLRDYEANLPVMAPPADRSRGRPPRGAPKYEFRKA